VVVNLLTPRMNEPLPTQTARSTLSAAISRPRISAYRIERVAASHSPDLPQVVVESLVSATYLRTLIGWILGRMSRALVRGVDHATVLAPPCSAARLISGAFSEARAGTAAEAREILGAGSPCCAGSGCEH
jgi:hypothetical protein